jgi:hypothetical protein
MFSFLFPNFLFQAIVVVNFYLIVQIQSATQ